MKFILTVMLIIMSGYILCSNADDHGENSVSYDKDSFEKVVTEKMQFVMFFAPWCGHCKRLAPTWNELAKLYNVEGSKVTIAKVDCTVERALCSEHGVKGYPTVKFFLKSKVDSLKYSSARTIEALKEFVEEQLAKEEPKEEPEEEVSEDQSEIRLFELTADTFTKHVERGHHFVKFYAPWCGHCKKLAPTWDQLANSVKDNKRVTIAKVDCTQYSSVCIQFNVRGYPTLLWLTDGQKVEDYRGSRQHDDLLAYVKKMSAVDSSASKRGTDGKVPDEKVPDEKVPDEEEPDEKQEVQALTAKTFQSHIAKGDHFVKFFTPWCGHCKSLAPVWEELAVAYKSNKKVTIAEVDCTEDEALCGKNDVKGYPTLIWFRDGKMVEKYNKGRSLKELRSYTEKMLSGDRAEDHVERFKKEIAKGYHFVEFYTPWCEHCKTLAPALDKLTKDLKKKGKVTVKKVDCQQFGTTICDANGIEVYPTLVWFKDGERIDSFSGLLDIDGLHAYVKIMVAIDDSPFKTLTADIFKKSIAKDHHFVEFYTPWCEHCQTLAPRLEELAEGLKSDDSVTVAKVDCDKYGKSVCDEMGVEVYPTLMWFKNGEKLDKFSGLMSLEGLKEYVQKMKSLEKSSLKDLTAETFTKKISKGHTFVDFYTPWCDHCKTLAPMLEELADSYKDNDKITIAKIDCTLYEKLCDGQGVEHYPVLMWFKDGEKVDSFSGVKSLEFLMEYVDKMLARDGNPLIDLTTSMFPSHIATGHHFVKFYAPWCGHCKRLAPTWQELADKLKNDNQISIAKIDCTAHGTVCEQYGVKGYPTLKFFKEGKMVEEYSGGRTLDTLLDYVFKMTVVETTAPPDFDEEMYKNRIKDFLEFVAIATGMLSILFTDNSPLGYHAMDVTIATEMPVMPLGTEDFEETIEDMFTFVAFMQPEDVQWKKMEPVWIELAESFDESDDIIVASVDCKIFKDVCKKYKVKEYPTLKLFYEGDEIGIYKGDQTVGGFNDFLEFKRGEVHEDMAHKHEHEEL